MYITEPHVLGIVYVLAIVYYELWNNKQIWGIW